MDAAKDIDVLIVGAGPSGLMMAAQLLRHGVQPTIIDAKPGPARKPNGVMVHARALEFFRQLGLSDHVSELGLPCYTLQLHARKKRLTTLDFSTMAPPATVFPFIQLASQDGIEKLLLGRLTEKACAVRWETRLESFRQNDEGAIATLVQHGNRRDYRCAWVIGADGPRSTLRALLNIPLVREPLTRHFFFADVEIEQLESRKPRVFIDNHGPLAVVPLGLADHYRIMAPLPEELALIGTATTLRYADVKPTVDNLLGFDLPIKRCLHVNQFEHSKHMAEQIGRQRCFLIGDAAHGVSPMLGRGLDEGVLDAANLAWKLAGVLNGRMGKRVLYTYQHERKPSIQMDEVFLERKERNWGWLNRVRDALLAKKLDRVSRDERRLRQLFEQLARLDINYRRSLLAVHHATGMRIRAGDRLPCLPVFDEKAKTHTDLHQWCEKAGFVLMVLGTISHHHLRIIGQWVRQKYPREMHLYYLPYSQRNQRIFDAFEMRLTGTKIVLVRPDMHVGYINDMLNVSLIDTYMEQIIGWNFFGHLPERH